MNNINVETPAETRERCRQHGAEWLGDRIEFRGGGGSHDRATVRAIFARHGLDKYLPKEPRPDTLLKRAATEGRTPRGYIQRPFVSPNPDTPLAIHVSRVSGRGESGDDFDCLARVRLAKRLNPITGEPEPCAVALPPEGQDSYRDFAACERARWIEERTNELLTQAHNRDLTAWTRNVVEGQGGVKSLGGGNNYYVPAGGFAEKIHALLSELHSAVGIYFLRDPKTSLGAKHVRQEIAMAAQHSLADDLQAIRDELKTAVEKQGGRKRTASLKHQIERVRQLHNKIELYRAVAERQVLKPLEETAELYRQHFGTLLDGGVLDWATVEPSERGEEVESVPAPSESGQGEVELCAAPANDDPIAWMV